MATSVRDKVFISYSRDDEKWLAQLLKVLSGQLRADLSDVWWDGQIKAGQVWLEQIQSALASARVAALLVSPGLLASEFILRVELPNLLNAATDHGVKVLWSLVRNCPWEKADFSRYQAVSYQETHIMKAWNALSEAELDDLLKTFAREIEDNLRADLAPPAAKPPAETPSVAASTPMGPQRVAHIPPASTPAESGHRAAKQLLQDVRELEVVSEIGDLFVLRERWADAKFTYDRMIELAAPYDERWMAWGYEKLGLIHRKEEKRKLASKCWKLAHILYRRTGKPKKAIEMEGLLQTISNSQPQAPPVTPPARPTPPK